MQLYLIRHAESANNAALTESGDESGRVPDPEITRKGHQQARKLAQYLARPTCETMGFWSHPSLLQLDDALHSYRAVHSRVLCVVWWPTPRSSKEAESTRRVIVAEKTGLPGPGLDYFRERFSTLELPQGMAPGGWYNRDFETEEPFLGRVERVLKELEQRHAVSHDRVAMVVHGDFIDQFANEVTGLAPPAGELSKSVACQLGVS